MASAAKELLDNFLDSTVETAELYTEYFLCPVFDSVPASIKEVEFNTGMAKSKNGEEEKPWFSVQFKYDIDSQEAREAVHRDTVTLPGRPIFLNLDKDGKIDPINNQTIARMIKMFGIDISGMSVRAIFDSFKGQYVTARVIHRELKDKDGNYLLDDEGKIRVAAEVSNIGPA